jgi:hypothetical protein
MILIRWNFIHTFANMHMHIVEPRVCSGGHFKFITVESVLRLVGISVDIDCSRGNCIMWSSRIVFSHHFLSDKVN